MIKRECLDPQLYDDPVEYWVGVDPITYNPTGQICWSYYPNDKPADSDRVKFIKVRQVEDI